MRALDLLQCPKIIQTCFRARISDEPEALVTRLAVVVARHARRPRAAHRRDRGARREPGAVAGLVLVAEVPALAAQEAELLAPVGQVKSNYDQSGF